MKVFKSEEITQIFEELDNDKAWLLECKDYPMTSRMIQDHINYLEGLIQNIYIGEIKNEE